MKKNHISVFLVILAIVVLATIQGYQMPALSSTEDVTPETPALCVKIYSDIDGIPGESTDAGYEDWIEVESFSFSVSTPTQGSTGSSRRRSIIFDDIILTKWVDKATPKLMEAVARGTVISSVEIVFTKYVSDSIVEYYGYELENVIVTSYQSTGTVGEIPLDTLTLSYEEITVTYTEYSDTGKPLGNVEWYWNVETGER